MKTTSTFLLLVLCYATSARGQTLEWTRQIGTSEKDHWVRVSADGLGNVYISGETGGTITGTNFGSSDVFLGKYDASGTLQWTRQLGSIRSDTPLGLSADGLGNVYISGETGGILGEANAGGYRDAFLSKFDASGTLQWTRQLGTAKNDGSSGVSVDGLGSVYISGWTNGDLAGTNAGGYDAFISKYDADGTLEWARQLGTSEDDTVYDMSSDGLGSVYISGVTEGSLEGTSAGGNDAFISKYDASGTLEWTRQFGTSESDLGRGVSADVLGNVYIAGSTSGSLDGPNAGNGDAFLSKYDANGTLQWTRQFGTSEWDTSNGVSADGLGNVYISGATDGSLGGANAGGTDVFLSKYDFSGTLQWTEQLGTSRNESVGSKVSADGLGNVYIAAATRGDLGGPNAGDADAFVAKFTIDLHEPEADFDSDGYVNGDDVDALVGEIVAGTNDLAFDLTADGAVDNADLNQWLSDAATNNGFNAPYLLGDANLDGTVNASDLNALGQNWLVSPNSWQLGDFTADGTVDANDLNQLGQNWLDSIPAAASPAVVPEPSGMVLLYVAAFLAALMRLQRNGAEHAKSIATNWRMVKQRHQI